MTSRMTFIYGLFLLVLISSVPLVMAGTNDGRWNSPWDYEPVTVRGLNLDEFLDDSISHIFAYSYNSAEDKWFQIPFQLDEKDDSSHVWVPNPNNILDNNDVVIFMARDMGDKAPSPSTWIDDSDSKNYVRYEITAADPNDINQRAWVYFYLSSTLQDTTTGYMSYTPSPPEKGSDIIAGVSYVEAHNDSGLANYWEIPVAAGGNGADLLDRQKARATAFYGIVDITEDYITLYDPYIEYIVGKIRVARRIWYNVLGLYIFDIPMYYYPYSIDSKGASGTLSSSYAISHIRQSFDLNSDASGMLFHNNFNTGILIDGSPDNTIDKKLKFNPEANWYMFTGDQGTILTLLKLDSVGTETRLYFSDDSEGNTDDGKPDTGDGQSWGDVGVLITGSALEGRFSIAYKTYFLPKNQSAAIGPEYTENFQHPLIVSITSQLVPVELSSFDAIVSKGKVMLTWTTVSESNNYGFEVQRKSASQEDWKKIGFVNGHGSTTKHHHYTFIDNNIAEDYYFYRLKQLDFDGSFEFSHSIEVSIQMPMSFKLEQNYPNPFNPETVIHYQIPELVQAMVPVELKIYNLLGDEVRTIVQKDQGTGFYSVRWDGKNNQGESVTAGTYIYRLRAGDFIKANKMLLLK